MVTPQSPHSDATMSKYLESTVPGEVHSWRRANKLELINSEPPEVRAYVVDRTVYPTGETTDRNAVQMDFVMTDPTVEIPIIDLETYEPTEQTFTAGEFQLMAASVALWIMRGQA